MGKRVLLDSAVEACYIAWLVSARLGDRPKHTLKIEDVLFVWLRGEFALTYRIYLASSVASKARAFRMPTLSPSG